MRERILKYLGILGRGATGIAFELICPLLVSLAAFVLCSLGFALFR